MEQAWWYWLILAIVNTPLYLLGGRVVFDGWSGFWECVRFWFTPEIFSAFRGEWGADILAEIKLGMFLLLCGLLVFGEHLLIQKLFG